MNATISSANLNVRALAVSFRRFAAAAACAALLASASAAEAGLLYANGDNINLAAGRATTFAGTPNPQVINSTELIQWPAYPGGDYRYGVGSTGPAQLVWDFGKAYSVGEYYFNLHTVFIGGSANFNFETSMDGSSWTPQHTFNGPTIGTGADVRVQGSFAPVQARYARLNMNSWSGYPNFIISKAQIYGDNDNTLTTRGNFSVAQSASNNGSLMLDDRIFGVVPRPAINDDGEDPQGLVVPFYSKVLTSIRPLPSDPSEITVTLNDSYTVDRVGFTSINDNRGWKDVNVWVSPDASGANWSQVLTLTNLPIGDIYQEFSITASTARRVRFDVLSDNGTNTDTYAAEVYVYAAPDAPALLDSNLPIGGELVFDFTPGLLATVNDAITLTNIGGNGSFIDITGYTITPGFALTNFNPAELVVGLDDSVTFDLTYDPLVATSTAGQVTFFTSQGPITFQLLANIPEPSTMVMLSLGLAAATLTRRRRPNAC